MVVAALNKGEMTKKQWNEFYYLRIELLQLYGKLKEVINECADGPSIMTLKGAKTPRDVFHLALYYEKIQPFTFDALQFAIARVNIAIGNIKNVTLAVPVQLPQDSAEVASFLFNKMQFHPLVVEASKSRFESGHYSDAIFAAFKAVHNYVKTKTKLSVDGKGLMTTVFSKNDPIIQLNKGLTKSEKDEQEGFMHIYEGAMQGIRNPKAHDEVAELDAYKTLEYLGLASLLMRRADEGKLKGLQKKQTKSTNS